MRWLPIAAIAAVLGAAVGCDTGSHDVMAARDAVQEEKDESPLGMNESKPMTETIEKTDEEWRKELTPEQFYVTRKKGTERAFTGAYWNTKDKGVYQCVCCGEPLFRSETKFDSGTGWPSFFAPITPESIAQKADKTLWATRTEVLCSRCGAHLGHVFDDGPEPTGLRYCLNSAALKLDKAEESDVTPEADPAEDASDLK